MPRMPILGKRISFFLLAPSTHDKIHPIMKNVINSVKGTRDFYPEDMANRIWLYEKVRKVSEAFGYQEFEAPILEKLDLYAAKSSEELVKKQSYAFLDKSGEEIVLRPELTPSLARMIAQRQRQLTYPLRWWSYGPFWRYEAPQKGRAREFFQWNIDQIGIDSPEADAEMVAIVATLFQEVGLTPDKALIYVNDRQLVNKKLENIGITDNQHQDTLNWIDRRAKMKPNAWGKVGREIGLSEDQINQVMLFLENDDSWQESRDTCQSFLDLGCDEPERLCPVRCQYHPWFALLYRHCVRGLRCWGERAAIYSWWWPLQQFDGSRGWRPHARCRICDG